MKTWVRKTLSVGVLAAGALLFAPGSAAHADSRQVTGANNGILNGTQIAVPVRVPVNIVGNSLGILGVADSHAAGVNVTESAHGPRGGQFTGVNNGILNGTQAYLPVSVPVNIAGNSAAVLGAAQSNAVAANGVRGRKTESAQNNGGFWPGSGGQFTGSNNGFLNGTQIYAPIDVPINVCGNSLAILGGAYSQAICANNTGFSRKKESGHVTEGGWQATGVNNGIANGTQLLAPISLPINLSGNSAALLGSASSHAVSVNESAQDGPGGFGQFTGANNGILNGTQIAVPISVPINACGNSLGILGAASSNAACVNGAGFLGNDDEDDWGWDADHGHNGHGHNGHGHKGHGHGDNAGDNGDDDGDYLGDNGDEDPATADDNGYGDEKPATADDNGYGGEEPATADDNGYGGEKPVTAGSNSDSKGGRGKKAEGTPVTGITEAVAGVSDTSGIAGLGLLNTLR
ncbi:chaplin family protein [Actinoplanes sp. NPDC026619]|uniref:chaplin family protein n=1 Tax=Actinoplanes sp. NPDC026619 TaxID=3155798 RepID=UPI0033D181DD